MKLFEITCIHKLLDVDSILTFIRRNLVIFHPHTLQLLFNLTTLQPHLAMLSLQAACYTN